MARKPPNISVRGVKQRIPGGFVVGRDKGDGQAQLLSTKQLRSLIGSSIAEDIAFSSQVIDQRIATRAQILAGTDQEQLGTPYNIAALWEKAADIASASPLVLGDGGYRFVTGVVTIADIDFTTDKAGRWAWLKFAGALQLTHSATLILPNGGSNIATAAGDTALFISEGSDVVRCVVYQRAAGTALVGTTLASTTEQLTGTNATKASTPDSVAALWEKGSDITSAATISIGEGGFFHVTGTVTITDIDFGTDHSGRAVWLVFDGALTLTHNATTLILPTGANIVTVAGDTCLVASEDGSDNVRILAYFRKDGTALTGTTAASTTEVLTGTNATKAVTPDSLAAIWEKGSDITSGATITIGEGGFFHVTGTTTITDIDFGTDHSGRAVWLVFDGALTLTHNATTLILPTGANIVTAAGDTCFVVSEDGSDNVRVVAYYRKNGTPLDLLTGGTQGDLIYYNGTAWTKLLIGSANTVLTSNGSGANPTWQTAGGGGTGGSPAADLASAILADSPIGFWKANEASGTLADSSGNSNTLTVSGSPTYQFGYLIPGSDEKFMRWATTQYAGLTGSLGLTMPLTGSFTFECVALSESTGTFQVMFYLGGDPASETQANNIQADAYYNTGNALNLLWERSTGTDVNVASIYSTKAIHHVQHIMIVKNATTVTFYLNGKQMGTATSWSNNADGGSGTMFTRVGGDGTTSNGNYVMGYVAVYSTALSAARAWAHAKAAGLAI